MPAVAVKPELIRWAIDRSGMSTEELLTKFPKLEEWKSGKRQPTFRQLEDFAKRTMAPWGAMFLDSPPKEELPIPDFRTKNESPLKRYSPNLLDTIQTMQMRQAWMREWLADEGAIPLAFVGNANITANFKTLAQTIRKYLNLDVGWAETQVNWEGALVPGQILWRG